MDLPTHTENRNSSVQTIFDARAIGYEDSWHPDFAKRFITLVNKPAISPGNRVIDLACGTGLVTFLVAQQIAPSGHVWGLDISEGMLKIAQDKQKQLSKTESQTVKLMHESIDNLSKIEEFEGLEDTFDLITCCSALVLLEDPGAAVNHWAEFLKPGVGRLIVDVPHPENLPDGLAFESALAKLGILKPYDRSWVKDKDSLSSLLSQGGKLEVECVEFIEQRGGGRTFDCGEEEARKAYDGITGKGKPLETWLHEHEQKEQDDIRSTFVDEWAARANSSGKIEEVDGVFVAVARRRL